MNVAPITTHVSDANSRFTTLYRNRSYITGFMASLIGPYQTLENVLYALSTGRELKNATGAQLDGIGQILGAPRGGNPDATYLPLLLAKIAENNSDGTAPALLNIVQTLYQAQAVFQDTASNQTDAVGPTRAAIAFGLGSPSIDPATYDATRLALMSAIGAGIGLFALYSFNATKSFAMAGPQAWVAGFGDLNDSTVGGGFATLLYSNPAL